MLEKVTHLNHLFDIYGQLLTEKQKRIFQLYYQDDLSLGEIGEEESISRQAVYDTLKRVSSLLEGYEEELKIHLRQRENNKIIHEIEQALDKGQYENIKKLLLLLKENMG